MCVTRCSDAAAVRAAAAAPELVEVDETLRRLLQRGRYLRHSEMLAVHEKLVSAVQQCGGLISEHLPASARDALGRLASLEPAESIDAVREDVISGSCQARYQLWRQPRTPVWVPG